MPLLVLAGVSAAAAQSTAPSGGGKTETAIFAGGCFWCVEEAFEKVPGVMSAVSGYTGGKVANPTYEQVSTGHRPLRGGAGDLRSGKVSYQQLVDWFWRNIDPYDAEGQFCDKGIRTIAALSSTTAMRRRRSRRTPSRRSQVGQLKQPIVTEILPAAALLRRRGLPPGLLQEEFQPLSVLQVRLRPRAAPGADLGQGHAAAEYIGHSWPRSFPRARSAFSGNPLRCIPGADSRSALRLAE